jgi:WD40 repeat protein
LWLDVGLFAVGTEKGDLHIYHINNNTNETMEIKKLAGSDESTSQSIHQSWLSNLSFISHSPLTFIITTAASDGTLSLWKFDLADASFSSGNLYVVVHIWDNADFALVGAMTFSSTGEHIAFSKSNRIFVSQLNVDVLFKLTHENVKEASIVISTTTLLIHPCRVSSIIWNTFNSIRIYTLSGDLINLKLNGSSAVLELISNETESLHDLLAKHAKNEVIDLDEEVEDHTNEASLISTQIVSVKKSIPIIGVYPSFHNLIDTICFKNDGLGSERKYYLIIILIYCLIDQVHHVLKYQFVPGFWKKLIWIKH